MVTTRPYDPAIPWADAFISSKGTTYVKEACAKIDQNSHHTLEIKEQEIERRRRLPSVRSMIFNLLILHSTMFPLVLEILREILICKIRVLYLCSYFDSNLV
jgi:hypothetical protein